MVSRPVPHDSPRHTVAATGTASGTGTGRGLRSGHRRRSRAPATPHRPLPTGRLLAHELAMEAAAGAIGLAGSVPPRLKPVAEQFVRSAASVPANLARTVHE